MQKMLPVQKILVGFPKAVIEPPRRTASNAAVSTSGSDAQKRHLQTRPFDATSRGFVLQRSPPFLPFASTARF
ncbi:hypothetical protein [Cribrihabitans neustonicus]|uniref:hypothetical protein n=1 Tax=Cribrihabitans neustonicus TaxID=1429085 RepID=UPI003B59DDC9